MNSISWIPEARSLRTIFRPMNSDRLLSTLRFRFHPARRLEAREQAARAHLMYHYAYPRGLIPPIIISVRVVSPKRMIFPVSSPNFHLPTQTI